jgi:hypothetical protein
MSDNCKHKILTVSTAVLFSVVLLAICSCQTGNSAWEKDITYRDIRFDRLRNTLLDGEIIEITGYIPTDMVIDDLPCMAGLIRFSPTWEIKQFRTSETILIGDIEMPQSTWVTFAADGRLTCVFPNNYFHQGYICKGGGGSTGVQTSFYPNGRLEYFFAPYNLIIDGIPCRGSNFTVIGLHENGSLKECTLAEDYKAAESTYKKRTQLCFSETGEIVDCPIE